ncbi:MAG TPA: PEGA domain-containing protein [Polyangiaceae bacterium]|nr:PEGA domain-containing protein [Polyangiaceae bacterium]
MARIGVAQTPGSTLLTTTLLPATPSSASPTSGAPNQGETKDKEAERLFYAGVAASDRGDAEAARLAFSKSYSLSGEPHALRNWGVSAIESGHWVEGAKQVQRYLAARPPGITEEETASLQEMLSSAERKIGRFVFVTDIEGAEVAVDGEPAGVTRSLPVCYVEPGVHTISARKAGYAPFETRVEAKAGNATVSYIKMQVQSEPPSSVAPTPSPEPSPALDAPRSHFLNRTTVTLGLATLTLGAAATWYGAYAARNSAEDQAKTLRAMAERESSSGQCTGQASNLLACRKLQDQVDRVEHWRSVAAVAEFATFGLAAASLGTWLLWPQAKPPQTLRVMPWTGPHLTGLRAQGSF